jgi:hypothetical protein
MTATAPPRDQLAALTKPFPRELVQRDPGGNSYVAHDTVTQFLLGIVGPFSFELVEIIRGDVAGVAPDPKGQSRRARAGTPALHQVVVGGVWRLCLQVDGRPVRLEEAGDVEDPHNWRHDGQRLKQAASDAIKRCAMRAGLGLHLWAGERYVLGDRLAGLESAPAEETDGAAVVGGVPTSEAIRQLESAAAAKVLVSRETIVSDRYRQAVKAAQVEIFGEVWDDFWRHANLDHWREVLEAARDHLRMSANQITERSGAVEQPGMAGEGDSPTAPAPADPSGGGASSPAPSPAQDASAAGTGDTGASSTAGHEPPDVEAQTVEAAAGRAGETTDAAGSEGTTATAAASTDLSGVGPVTAWCLRRNLSPGTVRLFLARHHPAEFGRQGRWPVGNVSELDALRPPASDRAVELARKQSPKQDEPRGWEGGGR